VTLAGKPEAFLKSGRRSRIEHSIGSPIWAAVGLAPALQNCCGQLSRIGCDRTLGIGRLTILAVRSIRYR